LDILLEKISKKYYKEWIFNQVDYHFLSNKTYAITGANGSGKSTLLQIIAGVIPTTKGLISYQHKNIPIADSDLYRYITLTTPYQAIIEEFTIKELFDFHFSLKQKIDNISFENWLLQLKLENSTNKPISSFSSGMKQRVKLGLAFYTQSVLLLLDEPTINLDKQGIDWYLEEVQKLKDNRTIIICSNQAYEYEMCNQVLDINNWKK
jgi:ABC-type multidrug transport system ATPase subunit